MWRSLLRQSAKKMKKGKINFYCENISYNLKHKRILSGVLNDKIEYHDQRLGEINFIFCNDEYLLDLNKKFLGHDYYTDILSFQSETDPVSGDIYISLDRIKENAILLNIPFINELFRVISHGVLHFIGFKDKTKSDKIEMRNQEDRLIDQMKDKIALKKTQ